MERFTQLDDVAEPEKLVKQALDIKKNPLAWSELGKGKSIALVFFNPSLRTYMSSQKAAGNLGLQVFSRDPGSGWKLEFRKGVVMDEDKAEHIQEAAAVISQYADIIGVRTFPGLADREADYRDEIMSAFVEYASVPVVSLESAIRHPLQSLADWVTIKEYSSKKRPKVVLSWAPHPKALPQAVANSFLEWMKEADVDLHVTHPRGMELAASFTEGVPVHYDQDEALEDADFVYVKNWSSYLDYGKVHLDPDWQITSQKMGLTKQAKFMHCLPVRRNVVVADEVLDSSQSLVIEQANNRTFAAQAVFKQLLENS